MPEIGEGSRFNPDLPDKEHPVVGHFKKNKDQLIEKREKGDLTEADFLRELNEVRWEILIEINGVKVNEGTQAIILSIDDHEISDYLSSDPDLTADEKVDLQRVSDPEAVLKLFKIFKRGSARAEIEKHQRAYEIMQGSAVKDTIKVPKLVETSRHELNIKDPELFSKRVGIHKADKVEFLAMEEVNGIDLASFVCQRAVIKRLQEDVLEGYSNPHLSLLQNTLNYILVEKGKFDLIKNKEERGSAIRAAARLRRVVRANFLDVWNNELSDQERETLMMVYGFDKEIKALAAVNQGAEKAVEDYIHETRDHALLEKLVVDSYSDQISANDPKTRVQQFWQVVTEVSGYQGLLPKNLNEDLRTALGELHENGFYHRDLHARNLMISEDLQTLYIIDFGSSNPNGDATNQKSNYEQAGEGSWMNDFELTTSSATGEGGLLFRLTATPEDKQK